MNDPLRAHAEFTRRRAALARRMYQLKIDVDHWNAEHPEEPIEIVLDVTQDVAELDAPTGRRNQ